MNRDFLEKLDRKIERALKDPELEPTIRTVLEVQSQFISFFIQGQEDHERLDSMSPWYKLSAAAWGVIALAGLGFVVGLWTGEFHIVPGPIPIP